MGLWRRRRKYVLGGLGLVLLVGVSVSLWWRGRVAEYQAGEETEGVVDRLTRHVPKDHPTTRFEDVAAKLGIDYRPFPGTRRNQLVEDMGSGVALGDVDNDGWCDVYLAGFARPDATGEPGDELAPGKLFRNTGGRFEDATRASGIEESGLGMAAAFVDVDGDAQLDLVTSHVGSLALWKNRGAGVFGAATAGSGLEGRTGFWAGLAVADEGLDGDLDVYVCGYVVFEPGKGGSNERQSQYDAAIPVMINPSAFGPEANLFLQNDGTGQFKERAAELGIDNKEGRSLGAVFTDLNADGSADLYVANDVSDNALFLADARGGFVEATGTALVGDYRGAMGLAAGDVDGDLDLDLFVTHWVAQENALYTQYRFAESEDGGPRVPVFFDSSEAMGLGYEALEKVGWATSLFDYDNDGLRDLLVVNGSTIPLADDALTLEPMRSQLFWKHPKRAGFFEVGAVAGDFFREKHVGRGGATFDFDLDGDEDLAIVEYGEGVALLQNGGESGGAGLVVRLRQPSGNRFAIGARVEVVAGEQHSMAVVGSDGSYLSQHAVGELGFGLGTAPVVDRVIVTWPDGVVEEAGSFSPWSLVTWERGSAPREEVLPGRLAANAGRPADAQIERAFFARRKLATRARLDGHLEEAVRLYRDALVLWPDHGDSTYYLANCLIGLDREAEALALLGRRVAYEPRASSSWMQIGMLRLPGGDPRLDDLDAADEAFETARILNREDARPVLMLGHVAMLRGESDAALEHYKNAAAHNPRSVEARWFAGRMAWELGDSEGAAAFLAEAAEIAASAAKSDSVSAEGDTESGSAMTAAAAVPLAPLLTRWSTLAEREALPELEYASGP